MAKDAKQPDFPPVPDARHGQEARRLLLPRPRQPEEGRRDAGEPRLHLDVTQVLRLGFDLQVVGGGEDETADVGVVRRHPLRRRSRKALRHRDHAAPVGEESQGLAEAFKRPGGSVDERGTAHGSSLPPSASRPLASQS